MMPMEFNLCKAKKISVFSLEAPLSVQQDREQHLIMMTDVQSLFGHIINLLKE